MKHHNMLSYPTFGFSNVIDHLFDRNFGEFYGGDFSNNMPGVNILETEDAYLLQMGVPGLKKEDFILSLENNTLQVSAKKSETKETTTDKIVQRGFNYQTFTRSFKLPELVDQQQIQAKYELGILEIQIPKIQKPGPESKLIPIN